MTKSKINNKVKYGKDANVVLNNGKGNICTSIYLMINWSEKGQITSWCALYIYYMAHMIAHVLHYGKDTINRSFFHFYKNTVMVVCCPRHASNIVHVHTNITVAHSDITFFLFICNYQLCIQCSAMKAN